MASSTSAPLARTAPLDGLDELLDRPGPFLTVVLDTAPAIDNAAQRSEQRWHSLRDAAEQAGVPGSALDGVDPFVADAHLDGPALFAVVDGEGGEPLLAEPLADLPRSGAQLHWAPLPSFVPLLADRQSRLPHVVVRCDGDGADILAVDGDRRTEDSRVKTDRGGFRKARSVGWREMHGWHRARRHRDATAESVAAAAAEAAGGIGAPLVVVTGDGRVVDEVVARLGERGLDARAVEGGRGGDGSDAHVEDEVATLVRTVVADQVVDALGRFKEQAPQGLAVEGAEETTAALAAGRVDVLLVHDQRNVEPVTVGVADVVDEAIRDAVRTSAAVLCVPEHAGPRGEVGALLRWAT